MKSWTVCTISVSYTHLADVYGDAIAIRAKLEAQAKRDQETSGRYIRPIVLFQAQPRNNADLSLIHI